MKLNNKGFAITSILYAVLVLFLSIIVAMLLLLANRRLVLDKYKKEVKENLNDSAETYGARVQISSDTLYVRIYEEEFMQYNLKSKISGCLNGNNTGEELEGSLCSKTETDISNLINYKIYDSNQNEVLEFAVDTIYGIDDYRNEKVDIIKYTYYAKDSNGNYIVREDGKGLEIVTSYLVSNKENLFFVKYYVVDSNNIISKESTRTLIIIKYDNYVKADVTYFSVPQTALLNYNYKNHAHAYRMNGTSLLRDDTLLNYALFDENDYKIIEFKKIEDSYYYNCEHDACKENGSYIDMPVNVDDKFRIRYFTGDYNSPTSDTSYNYFVIE